MQVVALIVEYNPFHNGHFYQIKKAKELFPNATLLCILNGNFLQRGEPSILDKFTRSSWALAAGVDIVLELPFAFGTQRADIFANGAVQIAAGFKADVILYGIEEALPEKIDLAKLSPNQKLAFFYQEAMTKYAPHIKPIAIKRKYSQYNSSKIEHENIASATAIRALITTKKETKIANYVPAFVANDLMTQHAHLGLIENYYPYLKYSLTIKENNATALSQYGLATNIYNKLAETVDFTTFFAEIHHKHTSKSHIRRLLTYWLCQIDQVLLDAATNTIWTRVLGLSSAGKQYLRALKQDDDFTFPVIQKIKELDSASYQLQYKSTVAYALITKQNIKHLLTKENSNNIQTIK